MQVGFISEKGCSSRIKKTNVAAAIEIHELKKYFGSTKAVDGVTLKVNEGEIFGFLGPNGAGKTTTIRCLMDFLRPDAGTLTIFGKDAHAASVALKHDIGYLSADVQLYDSWTGADHIAFLGNMRGSRASADRLVASFDFNPSIKVRQLSTGNKQKLGLILALMGEPKLLILDEPTRGLDPILQNTIYHELRTFREHGGTVFMSSHNLPEVEHICDRAAIVKEGKLVSVAPMAELTEKAVHHIQAEFSGPWTIAAFRLAGAEILAERPTGFSAKVTGDLAPIVKALAQFTVRDLEVTHATLEEAFFDVYNKG